MKRTDWRARIDEADAFDLVNIARHLPLPDPVHLSEVVWPDDAGALPQLAASVLQGCYTPLSPTLSAEVARHVLHFMAQDPAAASALRAAIAAWDADQSMSAIEILAKGVAVSLIIAACTFQFTWQSDGPLIISKEALSSQAIVGIVEILMKDGKAAIK